MRAESMQIALEDPLTRRLRRQICHRRAVVQMARGAAQGRGYERFTVTLVLIEGEGVRQGVFVESRRRSESKHR